MMTYHNQVSDGTKTSEFAFSIQLDESIDSSKYCQLFVYSRLIHNVNVKMELLLHKQVPGTAKGIDISNKLNKFYSENNLRWDKLVGCQLPPFV